MICSRCGYTYTEEYYDPIEHTWDEGVTVREADCQYEGIIRYTCTVCSESYAAYTDYGDHVIITVPGVAPACTDPGYSSWKECSVCGEIFDESTEIPATGHSYGNWTYFDELNHKAVCSNNSRHSKIAPHVWDDGVITKQPVSCVSPGVMTYTCEECGATMTESIPSSEHSFGEWTALDPADCRTTGTEIRICANDNTHTETREIPATDHFDGNLDGLCDYCNAVIDAERILSNCRCGGYHTGPFAGIARFIHSAFWFLNKLFVFLHTAPTESSGIEV